MISLNPPLLPRNGHSLMVLGVARISTPHQDVQSLADQEALIRQWVGDCCQVPAQFTIVATRGSGEWLDRAELLEIKSHIDSRLYDLVFMEDLGRYLRGFEAMVLCGACVDVATRLIATNDHIDTANEAWEDNALFASWRHKRYNDDTSRRIKQRLGNRFLHEGAVFQCPVFGYIKPPGCRGEQDISVDLAATPILDQWFTMLEGGATFAEVADWLNQRQVPVGPYCRTKLWTAAMVSRLTYNPIYKGVRRRNRMHTVKHHGSGHRVSRKAPPSELKLRDCPHLIHVDPARYDRVVEMVAARNARYRRHAAGTGKDPLLGRPRKRTRWPGQHCYCGICKRMLVFGAHGHNDHLVCRGTRDYLCWNGVSFDANLGAARLIAAILTELEKLLGFEQAFAQRVTRKLREAQAASAGAEAELDAAEARLARQGENVKAALRELGPTPLVSQELKQIEAEQKRFKQRRRDLQALLNQGSIRLPSTEQLQTVRRESFEHLAATSPQMGRILHRLIPRIVVYPHRLRCGGNPVLRAKFKLEMQSGTPTASGAADAPAAVELCVDLFEAPPYEKLRPMVLRLMNSPGANRKQRVLAAAVGTSQPIVQKILKLHKLMEAAGSTDPYELLAAPTCEDSHLRRHKHQRYRFQPLEQFEDETPSAALACGDAADDHIHERTSP